MHGFTFPCIMRKGTGSLHISPRRLLSLLLLQIILALAVQQVYSARSSSKYMPSLNENYRRDLIGGVPYVKKHRLVSRCSSRHVQMRLGKRINAKGNKRNRYTVLRFESDPSGGGYVRIQGDVSKKFLCFSKKGRLIARNVGESKRCLFKEEPHYGYIKLQSAVQPMWYVGFNSRGRKLYGYYSISTRRRYRYCFMFTKTDRYSRHGRRHHHTHSNGPLRKGDLDILKQMLNSRNR